MEQRDWTRIQAGPDAVEVRPSRIHGCINLRTVSLDGEVTLKPEEARALWRTIATALDANDTLATEPQETESRKTMHVLTDGGIGNLAAKNGIDLVVVPESPPATPRTLQDHAAAIDSIPNSTNGQAARSAYMREHGLVYVEGELRYG
jgi:hypothetical protein